MFFSVETKSVMPVCSEGNNTRPPMSSSEESSLSGLLQELNKKTIKDNTEKKNVFKFILLLNFFFNIKYN